MRRTLSVITALSAAAALAACSPSDDTTTEETTSASTEDTGAATSEAAGGSDAAAESGAALTGDPVCDGFFAGQGTPLAERADTQRDVVSSGEALDPVSYSELSLLQSRILSLAEDADVEQAALLERVNAPFTEVVDAVVEAEARMDEEITVPEVDVEDSLAAQDELEAACAA